jgi:hypothetical protein
MMTSGVVSRYNNVRRQTAARTWRVLQHCTWELSDYPSYSPDLCPSDYRMLTHLKNWLGSQRFNNNEELMEGAKRGWAHMRQTSSTQAYKNLFPVMTSASIPAVLRNGLSMYIFLYIIQFFSHCLFR